MSNKASPTSSSDENYYSAAEYISPLKGNANEEAKNNNNDDDDDTNLSASLNALNEASHKAVDFVNRCAGFEPPKEEDDARATSTAISKNPWSDMEEVADHLEHFRSKVDQAWRDARAVHDKGRQPSGMDQGDDDDDDDYIDDGDDESDGCDTNDDLRNCSIDFSIPINLDMEATIDVGGAHGNHETAKLKIGDTTDQIEEEEKEEPNHKSSDGMPADDFRALYTNMMMETLGDDLEEIHQQGENGNAAAAAAAVDVNVLVECLQSGINFLEPHRERNRKSFFESLGYDDDGNEPMSRNEFDENDGGLTVHQVQQRRLGYLVRDGA